MTLATAEVREADRGVPLYPSSKRDDGSLHVSPAEGSMTSYVFKTSDSPAQVTAFYRFKFDSKTSFVETPEGGMITATRKISGSRLGAKMTAER